MYYVNASLIQNYTASMNAISMRQIRSGTTAIPQPLIGRPDYGVLDKSEIRNPAVHEELYN